MAYLWGPAADVAFRRGWTHGILALALWPFVLTGAIVLLDRAIRRLRPGERPSPLVAGQVLLLAAVAVWSHPVLDTLNTYGVRWLMPFNGQWFYGDTLFIVDPWLWLTLAIGVFLSRSARRTTRPARLALGVSTAYAVVMAVSSLAARRIAARELVETTGAPVRRLMVSPLPVNPFVRRVVVDQGEVYRSASFRWLIAPHTDAASVEVYPKGEASHPAARAAAATTIGRRFLGWARFPAYEIEDLGAGRFVVHIVDLRYADRPGVRFGAVSIPVTIGRL